MGIRSKPKQRPASSGTGFDPAPPVLTSLGRLLMLGALVAGPWFFGCVRYVDQVWLYGLVLASAACCLVVGFYRYAATPQCRSLRVPALALPMLGVLILGAVQLVPGVRTFDHAYASRAPEFSDVELGDELSSATTSLYPQRTLSEIGKYSVALLAFLIGWMIFNTRTSGFLLWCVLAANGLAMAAFGIVQNLSWNGMLYWTVPLTNGGKPFAAFVNRNNAALYLVVCLACALGVLLRRSNASDGHHSHESVREMLARRLATAAPIHYLMAICIAVIGAGVVASTSRSGFLSMSVGAVCLAAVLAMVQKRSWPLVGLSAGAGVVVCLAFWFGFAQSLSARFDDLESGDAGIGRLDHWADSIVALRDVPVLGAGLGTYAYINPPYMSRLDQPWFVNADNQYVETAVESGAVGIVLLLSLLVLLAVQLRRGLRPAREPHAAALVLLFFVVAQGVHATFDFGVILPAVLVTSCVLLGSLVSRLQGAIGQSVSRLRAAPAVLAATLLVAGVSGAGILDAADAEVFLSSTRHHRDMELPSVDESLASVPVNAGPLAAEVHVRHARLLARRCELHAQAAIRAADPSLDDSTVARLGSLAAIRARRTQLVRTGRRQEARLLLDSSIVAENVPEAIRQARTALAYCAFMPRAVQSLAELTALSSLDAEARPFLQRAVRLEPSNEQTLVRAGLLALVEHEDPMLGTATLRRALTSSVNDVRLAVLRGIRFLPRVDEILPEVMPRDPEALMAVASSLRTAGLGEFKEILLITAASRPDVADFDRARLLLAAEKFSASTHALEQLVARDPENAEVRFELARSLIGLNLKSEAARQIRIAIGLSPQKQQYRVLLQQLVDDMPRALPISNKKMRGNNKGRVAS